MTPTPTGSSHAEWIAVSGALLCMAGVAAGAFGAHLLSGRLAPDALDTFQTGIRYHLVHALGLLALAALSSRMPSTLWPWAAGLLVAGILIFSGTLYGLALGGPRWLGAVTPLGGICFLAGWAVTAVAAWGAGG